jgi:hypothetical protein
MYKDANESATNGENKGNLLGKLFSRILQSIETNILNEITKKIQRRGFTVRSLVFDGLMIERDPNLNQQVLDDVCAEIAQEKQYDISLIFKSMNTKWTPEMSVESLFETQDTMPSILNISEARDRYYKHGWKTIILKGASIKVPDLDDDNLFLTYISKFVQQVKMTQNYLVRENSNAVFKILDKASTKSFLKHPEKSGSQYHLIDPIMLNPYMPQYDGIEFYINFDNNDTIPNKKIYNLFQRPKHTLEYNDTLDSFPLFKKYLQTVLCAGENQEAVNTLLFIWSNSLKYGKTDKCIVLYGDRGSGKSFTVEGLLSQIFTDKYTMTVIGFDHLADKFN